MDILEQIFAQKRADLEGKKAAVSLSALKGMVGDAPKPRGFYTALVDSPHETALIAEVKKASPVRGLIREDFDPVAIAKDYGSAGADCLSVLTDEKFFQGSVRNLTLCRDATELPVLRKDFVVDEYDVWQSRAMGADAILLIVAGLSPLQLKEYRELAEFLGMDALVEAHTKHEAEVALKSGASLVGVNNRNLKTFETDLENTEKTVPAIAKKATVVAESAIRSLEDVQRVAKAGARAVLVGTAFCQSPNIGAKVKEVMGW